MELKFVDCADKKKSDRRLSFFMARNSGRRAAPAAEKIL
jgi:hypothetical protein